MITTVVDHPDPPDDRRPGPPDRASLPAITPPAAPRRPAPRATGTGNMPSGPSVAEATIFRFATAVGLVHAFDDAVFHRQPGVPWTQHLPAALVTLAIVTIALLAFRVVRPGLRAGIAGTFGALALTNGTMHVISIARHGVSGSDITGVLAAIAGTALLFLALAIPFLHRRTTTRKTGHRWLTRAVAFSAVAVLAPVTVVPAAIAIVQTHMPRRTIAAAPNSTFRDVSLNASDGLTLSGWYTPSKNRAAIVLVSSAGGDRNGARSHARLLASHGYGVLLYDARGSGRSQGTPNGYGWNWQHDVTGALNFLAAQPDVDPSRIGALGLSTGADVLIAMAGDDARLAAIVADGATGRSFADMPPGFSIDKPTLWLLFQQVRLLSGTRPGPPLRALVKDVSPTPLLLIATGSIPLERAMNAIYAQAAREPVELWDLPHVDHTAGIRQVPTEYEQRVLEHFDRALLR